MKNKSSNKKSSVAVPPDPTTDTLEVTKQYDFQLTGPESYNPNPASSAPNAPSVRKRFYQADAKE